MPFTDTVPGLRGPAPLPATERQVAAITKMVALKQHSFTADDVEHAKRDKRAASDMIDVLINAPWKPREPRPEPKRSRSFAADLDLRCVPSGNYAATGAQGQTVFYHIDVVTSGKWADWVFVKLVSGGELDGTRAGSCRPGEGYSGSHTAAMRHILGDPLACMERFGRETGTCGACGRLLTDPESVARGIGPICAEKF